MPMSLPNRLAKCFQNPAWPLLLIRQRFSGGKSLCQGLLRDGREDDGRSGCEDDGFCSPAVGCVDEIARFAQRLDQTAHRRRLAADERKDLVGHNVVVEAYVEDGWGGHVVRAK